ncbi:RNA polymerase sigma factor (sigma-70 family) [Anaerobacterium chartisolvens]|uniref:RNA polymerase sigma factor (Sigma-70 family) n=1 Tax=Anaerobacterium chartisolvens TaxID=1297424 RepID=A0A369B3C1_9FIRM|nr:RNA polymerase sigma factor [Anaerobacterium chartisolvens]RCX16082.1 RNA polymerase sigma factor (sigma-70 family) [Anaerobacterium chartisolvens]
MNNEIDKLITNVKSGNLNDFALLYQKMSKGVYALAFSILGDKPLAEDAIHETFIRVKLMANSYASGTNGTAWVLRITRNICLNVLKKRKFEVNFSTNEQSPGFESIDHISQKPEYAYDKKNEFENSIERFVLKEALNKLKDNERQIVLLYSVKGLKHHEIADLLNIPKATERWQYRSAIGKLKNLLKNY